MLSVRSMAEQVVKPMQQEGGMVQEANAELELTSNAGKGMA